MMKLTGLALFLMLASTSTHAEGAAEPKTPEAVIRADKSWSEAEIRGDAAYLSELLLPGYVSISDSGKSTDRATIIANAAKRGASAEYAAKVAAWKAAHPSKLEVLITGDTAVLTSHVGGDGQLVRACDVFAYVDGHWRAVYSQHSTASS